MTVFEKDLTNCLQNKSEFINVKPSAFKNCSLAAKTWFSKKIKFEKNVWKIYQQLFDDARLSRAQIRRIGVVVATVVTIGENVVGECAVPATIEHVVRV